MIIAAAFVARWCRCICVLKRRKRGRAPPPHLSGHPAPDEFYNDPLSFRKFGKDCAGIEQVAGAIKRFKRIALRETARNYSAFVALARASILIKSVHRASEVPTHLVKSSRFLLRMKF